MILRKCFLVLAVAVATAFAFCWGFKLSLPSLVFATRWQ